MPNSRLPEDGSIRDIIYTKFDEINESKNLPLLDNLKRESQKSNQTLNTTPWPFLTNALGNVVDALKDLESMNLIINDVNVLKTTEAIVSDYFVEVSPGASKVKWKN